MSERYGTEARKGLADIRKQVRACSSAITWSDLWAEAEKLQHMAFDLKDLAAHGGTWAERASEELT